MNLPLPILDKITGKTIQLQDYTLSKGAQEGLAQAVQNLDNQMVNRILFNNNGITGEGFGNLLKGMSHLRDFKSIIYKKNQFSEASVVQL